MDLQALFRTLWKRRWILIIVPLFSICCAFLIRLFGEWKYKSMGQLATGITISDELIDNGDRFNPYEIQITFNNLIEMMKSRAVIAQVSYQLMLHDFSSTEPPFRSPDPSMIKDVSGVELVGKLSEYTTILNEKKNELELLDPFDKEQKSLQKVMEAYGYGYEAMLDELSIYRINNSDYLEITYISENPQLSAFVVNTICDEFIRYYTSVKANRSSVSLESLTSIVEQRKKYLNEKLEELKNFKSNNEIVNSGYESETKIRQIRQYEDDIADEQKNIRGLELTLANLNVRIQEAEGGMGNHLNQQIIDLRRKINTLNEQYVLEGQSNQALLDSITLLRKQVDAYIRQANQKPTYSAAELAVLKEKREQARIDLEVARENFNSMNNILNSIRYTIGDFASKEAVSKALEKEVEVAREEYLSSQERYNEAKEKMVTNKASIVQVLYGEPAERPESRKTILFMIFSGVLSFAICAFVIIMLELMDSRIRSPKRLKKLSKLPIAGVIPKLPKSIQNLSWNFFFNGNGHANELNKLNNDLRKIRFTLDNNKSQVLLITSTQKDQGKTFFIMALAYTFSLIKKRTLIIDTNLRHNSLTKMLTARTSLKQLMEYYNKNAKQLTSGQGDSEQQAPKDDNNLITHTNNDFVDIIGNKSSQFSPSEVIPGGDFNVLLEWLRVQYDYIILEGANLNEFSDSRELAGFVDLVIPVFSAEATLTDQDKESLAYLKTLNEKLGPSVLNNFQPEETS